MDRGLSLQEEADLDDWLSGDSRRAGALARAMAGDSHFARAAALGETFEPAPSPPPRALSRRHLLIGASGALAASLVGIVGFRFLSAPDRIATAKGDVRRVAMAEGSAVTLNTATEIEPAFDSAARRIRLLQGEALFDVARDPARPFTVMAAGTAVRAIGTSFTVRLHEDGKVGVTVYEGIVEVSRGEQTPLRLLAGSSTLVVPNRSFMARPAPQAERERAIAWRHGRLDLTSLTLGEAATEFGRYSDYHIIVDDPAIAALEVTGVYSTSDPRGFAEAAALSLGLGVRARDGGIAIVPAP